MRECLDSFVMIGHLIRNLAGSYCQNYKQQVCHVCLMLLYLELALMDRQLVAIKRVIKLMITAYYEDQLEINGQCICYGEKG